MLLILGMSPDEVVNAAVRMLLYNVNSGSCVDDMLQDQVWSNCTHIDDIKGSVLAYPLTYYLASAERENGCESLALAVSKARPLPVVFVFFRTHNRRSLKRKWRVCEQASTVPNLLMKYPRQGLLSTTLTFLDSMLDVKALFWHVCHMLQDRRFERTLVRDIKQSPLKPSKDKYVSESPIC